MSGAAAAVVSFIVQTVVYAIQKIRNVPFVNPEWVETVIPLVAKLPLVGGYFAMLPVDAAAWILSFIVLWLLFWMIFSTFKGSAGYIVALLVGAFIIYIWTTGYLQVPSIPPPTSG